MRREFHDVTKIKINVNAYYVDIRHRPQASIGCLQVAGLSPPVNQRPLPHTQTRHAGNNVYMYLHDIFLVLVSYMYVSAYTEPKNKASE
jgi:hypothetical protein